MFKASSVVRTAVGAASCALALLGSAAAAVETINASLNLHYTDPENLSLGGNWEVVIKTSAFYGLSGVNLKLTNINPTVVNEAPRGNVNGSDPAGFSLFESLAGARLIAQEPLYHFEEGMFYGVGSLAHGSPGERGHPFTTLTNTQGLDGGEWATGDVFGDSAWDTAVRFISGTFGALTPAWVNGSTGNVFTDAGTTSSPGTSMGPITITDPDVRTNLSSSSMLPDYNHNGIVDAADYVLWRHGDTAADGNNDTFVNEADYDLWRQFFGATVGGAGGGAAAAAFGGAVPEPASAVMLALGASLAIAARRKRNTYFRRNRPRQGRRPAAINFCAKGSSGDALATTRTTSFLPVFWPLLTNYEFRRKNQIIEVETA